MHKGEKQRAVDAEEMRISALKRLIGQANKDKPGANYQLLRTIAEMDTGELMPEVIPVVMPAEITLEADARKKSSRRPRSSRIRIVSPILNALDHVEAERLHACPECDDIFYDRPNKKTCSVACGNRKQQRDFRNNPDNADKIAGYRNRAEENRIGKATPIHAQSPIFQKQNRSKAK